MYHCSSKILDLESLKFKVAAWKLKDHVVVLTNGCFDLLHLGHVDYLEKAAALGTKLIVAINSDASVKQLKGEERPLQDAKSRSRLIAAMEFVDAVILFDQENPMELIKELNPDVLVKGNDYSVEEIVGHEFVLEQGGKVQTIPLVEGYSTSRLIQIIKNS